MKNDDTTSSLPASSPSRRQFLAQAGALTGVLVLGKNATAQGENTATPSAPATVATEKSAEATSPTLVLKLNENPELGKVGGWKIFELGEDKVIVASTEAGVVACSAICTHKGCEIEYNHEEKQFFCPCHKAQFDLEGKVVRGPAKKPLQKYDAAQAILVGEVTGEAKK